MSRHNRIVAKRQKAYEEKLAHQLVTFQQKGIVVHHNTKLDPSLVAFLMLLAVAWNPPVALAESSTTATENTELATRAVINTSRPRLLTPPTPFLAYVDLTVPTTQRYLPLNCSNSKEIRQTKTLYRKDRYGETEFDRAINEGKYTLIKTIIENGYDLYKPNGNGMNAIDVLVSLPPGTRDDVIVFISQCLDEAAGNEFRKASYNRIDELMNYSQQIFMKPNKWLEHIRYLKQNQKLTAIFTNSPLMRAAIVGNLKTVKYLVEVKKINIAETDRQNFDVLSYACLFNQPEVVQFLLSKGAYQHYTRDLFSNGIFLAALNGHSNIIQIFIDFGFNIDLATPSGLLFSIADNQESSNPEFATAFSTLLKMGANPHQVRRVDSKGVSCVGPGSEDAKEITLLEACLSNNFTAGVKELLQYSVDVNQLTSKSALPISLALLHNNVEVVALLSHRTDLKKKYRGIAFSETDCVDDIIGREIFNIPDLTEQLKNYNASPELLNAVTKRKVDKFQLYVTERLSKAISDQNLTEFLSILKNRKLDIEDSLASLVLMRFKDAGERYQAFSELIKHKIDLNTHAITRFDPNYKESFGPVDPTLLEYCILKSFTQEAKLLLDLNANIQRYNSANLLPIHYAAREKNYYLVNEILKKDFNVIYKKPAFKNKGLDFVDWFISTHKNNTTQELKDLLNYDLLKDRLIPLIEKRLSSQEQSQPIENYFQIAFQTAYNTCKENIAFILQTLIPTTFFWLDIYIFRGISSNANERLKALIAAINLHFLSTLKFTSSFSRTSTTVHVFFNSKAKPRVKDESEEFILVNQDDLYKAIVLALKNLNIQANLNEDKINFVSDIDDISKLPIEKIISDIKSLLLAEIKQRKLPHSSSVAESKTAEPKFTEKEKQKVIQNIKISCLEIINQINPILKTIKFAFEYIDITGMVKVYIIPNNGKKTIPDAIDVYSESRNYIVPTSDFLNKVSKQIKTLGFDIIKFNKYDMVLHPTREFNVTTENLEKFISSILRSIRKEEKILNIKCLFIKMINQINEIIDEQIKLDFEYIDSTERINLCLKSQAGKAFDSFNVRTESRDYLVTASEFLNKLSTLLNKIGIDTIGLENDKIILLLKPEFDLAELSEILEKNRFNSKLLRIIKNDNESKKLSLEEKKTIQIDQGQITPKADQPPSVTNTPYGFFAPPLSDGGTRYPKVEDALTTQLNPNAQNEEKKSEKTDLEKPKIEFTYIPKDWQPKDDPGWEQKSDPKTKKTQKKLNHIKRIVTKELKNKFSECKMELRRLIVEYDSLKKSAVTEIELLYNILRLSILLAELNRRKGIKFKHHFSHYAELRTKISHGSYAFINPQGSDTMKSAIVATGRKLASISINHNELQSEQKEDMLSLALDQFHDPDQKQVIEKNIEISDEEFCKRIFESILPKIKDDANNHTSRKIYLGFCGELYNKNRRKRFIKMQVNNEKCGQYEITKNLITFLQKCFEIHNLTHHEFPDATNLFVEQTCALGNIVGNLGKQLNPDTAQVINFSL